MWRPPPPAYNVPRGYVPRGGGGYEPREARDYERYRQRAPSPWIPATILGVVLLITWILPAMRGANTVYPDPVLAYQAAAAAAAARPAYSFPLPLMWLPVIAFIGFQFFGGNWFQYYDGYGFRGGRGGIPYGARGGYRGDAYAPPGAYRNRGVGPEYNRGWGGWWPWSAPSWNENNRYINPQQRGLMSMFMDYGGHWLLILVGIAVFSLVSAGASASSLLSPPAVLPAPPLAPPTLGFPWSLFF